MAWLARVSEREGFPWLQNLGSLWDQPGLGRSSLQEMVAHWYDLVSSIHGFDLLELPIGCRTWMTEAGQRKGPAVQKSVAGQI